MVETSKCTCCGVVETDGVGVKYQMMDTIEGGIDSNDEGEVWVVRRR
jgi:hypothetical protein